MFLFVFVFLIFVGVAFSQDAIQCHVKAGYGNKTTVNKGIKTCTSQMCLAFYDFSDNFWATNCFQIGTPLSLGSTFKQVATRNKKRPKNSYFFYCLSDNCNADPYITMDGKLNGFMIVLPDPISFDYKLFPSLGKEPLQSRQLQNSGYTFETTKNFIGGYVFSGTKTVWAQFQFINTANKITIVNLNYNIVTSTLTTTYGNVKSVKKLTNQYSPDDQLYILFYVTVSEEGDDHQILINNDYNNALKFSKSQFGEIFRASYGGKWRYVDSSGNYQIAFPRSLAKSQDCSSLQPNSKMTIISINNFTNSEFQLPMIFEGQKKSFEFRKSLCPGSDMIKFDVALVKHFSGKYYFHSSIYFRKKLLWNHIFTQILAKSSDCSFIAATEYNNMASFSCGNDIINKIANALKIGTFLKGFTANVYTVNSVTLWKEIKYLVY